MSLVRDIDRQPLKQRLVRSMTELCQDNGTQVIGEGVETEAEAQTLVDLGCDLLQGYLLARPALPFCDPL
jgi:EAL domain-containing protein (putative c-di-GMP-specific phosphodiesterase class I)